MTAAFQPFTFGPFEGWRLMERAPGFGGPRTSSMIRWSFAWSAFGVMPLGDGASPRNTQERTRAAQRGTGWGRKREDMAPQERQAHQKPRTEREGEPNGPPKGESDRAREPQSGHGQGAGPATRGTGANRDTRHLRQQNSAGQAAPRPPNGQLPVKRLGAPRRGSGSDRGKVPGRAPEGREPQAGGAGSAKRSDAMRAL